MQNIKVFFWSKLYLHHWKCIFTFIAQNVEIFFVLTEKNK